MYTLHTLICYYLIVNIIMLMLQSNANIIFDGKIIRIFINSIYFTIY